MQWNFLLVSGKAKSFSQCNCDKNQFDRKSDKRASNHEQQEALMGLFLTSKQTRFAIVRLNNGKHTNRLVSGSERLIVGSLIGRCVRSGMMTLLPVEWFMVRDFTEFKQQYFKSRQRASLQNARWRRRCKNSTKEINKKYFKWFKGFANKFLLCRDMISRQTFLHLRWHLSRFYRKLWEQEVGEAIITLPADNNSCAW